MEKPNIANRLLEIIIQFPAKIEMIKIDITLMPAL